MLRQIKIIDLKKLISVYEKSFGALNIMVAVKDMDGGYVTPDGEAAGERMNVFVSRIRRYGVKKKSLGHVGCC